MASGDAGTGAPHVARRTEQGMIAQAGCMCHGAMGRLTRLVYFLALASVGFGIWTIVRMIDGAGIGEQLLWMGGAWTAWVAIIAIKLWIWSRENPVPAPVADASPIVAEEIGELQVRAA